MAIDYQDEHRKQHEPDIHGEQEPSDINVGATVGFGVGLALCIALVCLVLYGAFNALRKGFTAEPANMNALAGTHEPLPAEQMPATFPSPRLQVNYFADMAAMRKEWSEQLDTYGWVDKNAGVVHIPIEQAIALTAERGLPARPAEQPAGAPAPNQKPRGATTQGQRKPGSR